MLTISACYNLLIIKIYLNAFVKNRAAIARALLLKKEKDKGGFLITVRAISMKNSKELEALNVLAHIYALD